MSDKELLDKLFEFEAYASARFDSEVRVAMAVHEHVKQMKQDTRQPQTYNTMLKPNGISHTVYPENPAKDYNEWIEHITRKEVEYYADDFKDKFDRLWADFKRDIQKNT